jgi:hypothetical protein
LAEIDSGSLACDEVSSGSLATDHREPQSSRALQTFVIQLASHGSYLPTPPVVMDGGYGAIAVSNLVGPGGEEVLVDRTVNLINPLSPAK